MNSNASIRRRQVVQAVLAVLLSAQFLEASEPSKLTNAAPSKAKTSLSNANPTEPNPASISDYRSIDAIREAYFVDARTNLARLEKPLYTNGPCTEASLRSAALAGDGYAAALVSGTSVSNRTFWEHLAATNGWIPAQRSLADDLEDPNRFALDLVKNGVATDMPTNLPANPVLAKYWRAQAKAALPKLKADAEQNDARALYALHELHLTGKLVQSNGVLAADYLERAAKLGLAAAQWSLGGRKQLETNCVEAAQWYFQAATQGLIGAQQSLSALHRRLDGKHFDPRFQPRATEAARWEFEVANQRPCCLACLACFSLGKRYQEGNAV